MVKIRSGTSPADPFGRPSLETSWGPFPGSSPGPEILIGTLPGTMARRRARTAPFPGSSPGPEILTGSLPGAIPRGILRRTRDSHREPPRNPTPESSLGILPPESSPGISTGTLQGSPLIISTSPDASREILASTSKRAHSACLFARMCKKSYRIA